jgi:2-amino-4-hydroxy-6-hydroxymethyldihydropteridine diphosphokinase
MNDLHSVFLSLGSNVQPEVYLPKAIEQLREYGQVQAISKVWESHAVGGNAPNFLNACVLFMTALAPSNLKEQAIRPIEARLGRVRSENKNAPRTIDIDIVMADGDPVNLEFWNYAFIVVPMADIAPKLLHPITHKKMSTASRLLRSQVWIVQRSDASLPTQ